MVGLLLGTILVELLYFVIRLTPRYWWLADWAVFSALFIFFAQIAPVVLFPIFYKFRPLQREELKNRLTRLSEHAGARVLGVYEWKLSEKSKKANAALTGLGKTRRILLADTLLEHYSDDEIEAVLAHELGHHVHNHVLKSIGVQAGILFVGFWTAARILHYAVYQRVFIGDYDFANLPLLALIASVLSLLLAPALNAWSRHNERQADSYAFRSIPSTLPFVSSMNKLAAQNLAERTPSRLVEWLFHSHPPISKRIAAAQDWALNHEETPAQR
jgi:STE24 endopeptidase